MKGRRPDGTIMRGFSGNPGGRIKKVTKLLRMATKHAPRAMAYAVALLDEPELSEEPKDMLTQRKVKLEAAKLLMAYGIGSPPKLGAEVDEPGARKSALSKERLEAVASMRLSTEQTAPDGSTEH